MTEGEQLAQAIAALEGQRGTLGDAAQPERALELLGLAANHPALDSDARSTVALNLAYLRAQLPPEVVAAGLERGRALQLENVVAELLAQSPEPGSARQE